MANIKKQDWTVDKKKHLREVDRLTRPPRLEGAVKNKMMNPVRKKKKVKHKRKTKR